MEENRTLILDEGPVSQEFLQGLNHRCESLVSRMEEWNVGGMNDRASRIRYCKWDNQQWDERAKGEDAFPFDGASDMRMRLAEYLVQQRVSESIVALLRSQISFGALADDNGAAKFLARTWRNILDRDLGAEWLSQMTLLAMNLHASGRGCAGLWIGWDKQTEMRPRTVTMEELAQLFEQSGNGTANDFMLVSNDAPSVRAFLEQMGVRRPGRVARELVKTGRARVWEPDIVRSRPAIRALALGQDFFIDPLVGVMRGDDAPEMHLVDWLTPEEVRARGMNDGWSDAFVDGVLRQLPGSQTALFPTWEMADGDIDRTNRVSLQREAGKYQIIRTYVKAQTKDGVPARFCVVWSPGVEVAATDAELVDVDGGGWPILVFSSEVAGPGAMDSIGVPEKAAGFQTQLKLSADMLANQSILQLPPVKTIGIRDHGGGDIIIEPLGQINLGANEDVSWMTPPPVSMGTLKWLETVQTMAKRMFGLPDDRGPSEETQTLSAQRVTLWLTQCAEAVRRILATALAHMDPREFAKFPEIASGRFPVRLRCDPRSWNLEYVEKVARVFQSILLPMDRKGRLNLENAVDAFVLDLLPEHAELVQDTAVAQDGELQDEERNLTLIRSGIRPKIPEGGGYDYAGRLQFIEQMHQANPQVFQDMGPDKQQLLQEHIQALQFQLQQAQNADIGRQGFTPQVQAPEAVQIPTEE